MTLDPRIKARLKYDSLGLVAAVVQQYDSHEVLMVGYMDDEALRRRLTKNEAAKKTEKQRKKEIHFPQRKYAIKV